jgi:hypothetical protein
LPSSSHDREDRQEGAIVGPVPLGQQDLEAVAVGAGHAADDDGPAPLGDGDLLAGEGGGDGEDLVSGQHRLRLRG